MPKVNTKSPAKSFVRNIPDDMTGIERNGSVFAVTDNTSPFVIAMVIDDDPSMCQHFRTTPLSMNQLISITRIAFIVAKDLFCASKNHRGKNFIHVA